MTDTKPFLDGVKDISDLRSMSDKDLTNLAGEVRTEMIEAVAETGGHLGAGLGVVELTVALHHVFETPRDRLIWDVGHQCYPHKILTGRRGRIRTPRQPGLDAPAIAAAVLSALGQKDDVKHLLAINIA